MPTILAVDDDSVALSALTTTLQRAGYDVQAFSSIDQARHFLDESDPDLIVLEVDSDQGAGWTLLRDIVRFEGPPTIVVSHRGREEEIVEALTIGAVDFLPKPFRSNELIARIQARIGQPYPKPPVPQPLHRTSVDVETEPIFMADAEEQALIEIRSQPVDPGPPPEDLPLGARLHEARQRRKLSLVQVNLDTKIPIWYLQAMEEEKFSLLPRGPGATEMVRTYADYLGLDSARALTDYRSHHDASPFKPLPSLGGAPEPRDIPPWISVAVAAALALALGLGAIWWLAGDDVRVLGGNLRGFLARDTATVTPAPTIPATTTPQPTRSPTVTRTPVPTRRATPVPQPTTPTAPSDTPTAPSGTPTPSG